MSELKLPEGAYAALEGFKAQAVAAMQMFPTNDTETIKQGKKALAVAHGKIAANDQWANKIYQALKASGGEHTVVSVDNKWLERTFADDLA